MTKTNSSERYRQFDAISSQDPVQKQDTVVQYISSHDVEKSRSSFGKKSKIGFVIGSLLVGGFIAAAIEGNLASDNEAPVAQSPSLVSADELSGQTVEEAEETLNEAGIENISIYESSLEDFDIDPEEATVGAIVDNASIDDFSSSAELAVEWHPLDIIDSLDLEGERWVDAQRELNQAGLNYESDYWVHTDSGTMYVERNWSIDHTYLNDDGQARIVLTNHTVSGIEEGIGSIGESAQNTADDIFGSD